MRIESAHIIRAHRLNNEVDVARLPVGVGPETDIDLLCFGEFGYCLCRLVQQRSNLRDLAYLQVREMDDVAQRLDDQ